MRDLIIVGLLCLCFVPLTLLVNRTVLALFPARRSLPGQGTVAFSSLAGMALCLAAGILLLGDTAGGKLVWAVYLALILGCALLVFVSAMCVSESGRRYYLMHLVDRQPGLRMEDLQAAYGRDHMLGVRLERLTSWRVLSRQGDRFVLVKPFSYLACACFHAWGRMLGFRWF